TKIVILLVCKWDTEVYMVECADELEELARYLQCLHSPQEPSL
uniref:Uncharacterized protein n=1 Tax=Panagrolaimus sp. PS1159 TaxID=55785 RepID=A0AC35FLX9_9BILA